MTGIGGDGADRPQDEAPTGSVDPDAHPVERPLDAEDVRLIETARALFAERGVKGTSTDDIARAAGVTRVTLYRRLGTRDQIIRRIYAFEAERLMLSVNARFTAFDSLEWDPVRHVEDLLVGVAFDIRDSDLLQRLIEFDRADTIALLATESDSVMWGVTELLGEFVRNTWEHDVHSREMSRDEAEALSRQIGSVVGRFLHSVVVMPDGPPDLVDEEAIRELARRVLVPVILQR